MGTNFCSRTIDKQACADWPGIQAEAARYREAVIEVREYDEEREVTNQQFAYLHAVVWQAGSHVVEIRIGQGLHRLWSRLRPIEAMDGELDSCDLL